MDHYPFLNPTIANGGGLTDEMIKLENRMVQMLTERSVPDFFKTQEQISADFNMNLQRQPEFIYYSDTLDGCMNIQQSRTAGYMEENY